MGFSTLRKVGRTYEVDLVIESRNIVVILKTGFGQVQNGCLHISYTSSFTKNQSRDVKM